MLRCPMMQSLMSRFSLIVCTWKGLWENENEALDPALFYAWQTFIWEDSPAGLPWTSLTVKTLPCWFFLLTSKYIDQVEEHYDKLFLIKVDIKVVFIFSQENFCFKLEFIQLKVSFFFLETQWILLQSRSPTCCAPILLVRSLKSRWFLAFALIKLITLAGMSLTSNKSRCKFFDAESVSV